MYPLIPTQFPNKFLNIVRAYPELFVNLFEKNNFPRFTQDMNHILPVTITEQAETYTLTAPLPNGVQKDHITVEIDSGMLSISVKQENVKHSENEQVIFDERQAIDITRRFNFKDTLGEGEHEAKVENGNLVLILKKAKNCTSKKLQIT